MSEFNTKGKLPFTVTSSQVEGGYLTELKNSVGQNIDIVNYHQDIYSDIEGSTLQGPFTEQHVGGNQERHVKLNDGSDNRTNRPESITIVPSSNSVKIYGADYSGLDKPRSLLTRDGGSKSPINVKNIKTSENIAGNYTKTYEVIQTVGRRNNNNLISDNLEADGVLTTKFIKNDNFNYSLSNIERYNSENKFYKNQSTFVERFNAPGGKEVSSRGAMNIDSEEYAPNNSYVTRNIKVRQPFYNKLSQHSVKPFLSKLNFLDTSLVFGNISLSITFGNNGLSFYTTVANITFQFKLTKKYDLSTAKYYGSLSYPPAHGAGIAFDNTGNILYQAGTLGVIKLYNLTIPWDITTATYVSDLTGFATSISGITFANEGNKFYTISSSTKLVECFTLSTAWTVNSSDPKTTFTLTDDIQISTGIALNKDGTRAYFSDRYNGLIYEYCLSTPYDISTASFNKKHFLGNKEAENFDIFLDQEQNDYLFILDRTNKRVDCYINFISTYATIENINKNSINRIKQAAGYNGESYVTASRNDNFWVQHAIPATDLRYKWIADSITSSQQPIEYQSYGKSLNNPYSSYGIFNDLEFEKLTPFGDHYGISGSIDKSEVYISPTNNTFYRNKKFLKWNRIEYNSETENIDYFQNFSIDLSPIATDISEKDFTISFWIKYPNDAYNFAKNFPVDGVCGYSAITQTMKEPILTYSGSYENSISLIMDGIKDKLVVDGEEVQNRLEIYPKISDDKWHFITIVSDLTERIKKIKVSDTETQISINTTTTKIYFDGELISNNVQLYKKFDISSILFKDNGIDKIIDEIYVWDRVLNKNKILELYKATKNHSNDRPKKYMELFFDDYSFVKPKHAYSSNVELINNKYYLLDRAGSINVELNNYQKSLNLRPELEQIVSFSTYYNGPYQHSNWKSLRNSEHPITNHLSAKEQNVVSVLITDREKVYTKKINGKNVQIRTPPSKKAGTILNIKESPIYLNKPLKHRFVFKGTNNPDKKGYEITHTYKNNIKYFNDQKINNALNLEDKKDDQFYDKLYDFYGNDTIEEKENPISKFLGYTFEETILPRQNESFLNKTRRRNSYIVNQAGFNEDGYDRQLGTQRAFWRDSQENRLRTSGSYYDSLNHYINLGVNSARSIAALDEIEDSYKIAVYSPEGDSDTEVCVDEESNPIGSIVNGNEYGSFEYYSTSSGELNDVNYLLSYKYSYRTNCEGQIASSSAIILNINQEQYPEFYYSNNLNSSRVVPEEIVGINDLYTNLTNSLYVNPSYTYKHSYYYNDGVFGNVKDAIETNTTIDLGLNRYTEKISNKKPWYDSYDEYSEDVRSIGKDYSLLPEFKISDYMTDVIKVHGGNFRKVNFQSNINNISIPLRDNLEKQNKNFVKQDKIKFNISVIKKLLPYNGFYPQDRSIQLVNLLKDSYLDTGAVKGGLYLSGTNNNLVNLFYSSGSNTLQDYLKESTFLEGLYAPGIFYNTIKSGIAMDWPVYTGSLPSNENITSSIKDLETGDPLISFIGLAASPSYRLPFETILDPFIGYVVSSSENYQSNRIIKTKDIDIYNHATDFYPNTSEIPASNLYSFQGFCELEKKSNPLYTLSVNNFFAETINFFLKNSKLNSFISKPDNEWKTMKTTKTYYMDVVLRKTNNFKMIDAYSSSLAINDMHGKSSGKYFGPGFFTGTLSEIKDIASNNDFAKLQLDPCFAAYTPAYFYGTSIARISFKPSVNRKYSFEEIISQAQIEYINLGLRDNNQNNNSSSLYEPIATTVETSMELFGQINQLIANFQVNSNTSPALRNSNNYSSILGSPTTVTSDLLSKKWVISTKMETPVLDFNEQEYISNSKFLENPQNIANNTGFGIGMWSGYGQIPTGSEGIYVELRESYPHKILDLKQRSTTGSLLNVCGFTPQVKRVGELSEDNEKSISEAIIIIPYVSSPRRAQVVRINGNNELLNDTVKIDNYNFFKINRNIFQKQKTNIQNGKHAIEQGDLGSEKSIQSTSISKMIELMNKYVIPPNYNFLEYSDIHPFVMYIAEFESKLTKQDLADIWQGVMPSIAMSLDTDDVTISQDNTLYDFFHGKGLPEKTKFMIFKVKRKSEINYYKMTSNSLDDNRFKFDFENGKKAPEYSYNWPYDYCSLIELSKIDIEIDYETKDTVSPLSGSTAFEAFREHLNKGIVNRTNIRGLSGLRGKLK